MQLSPRQAAKAAGAKTYHGSACKNGCGTERRTDNGACIVCHRANQQAWIQAHPDRVRANERKRRKADAYREKQRARYASAPDAFRKSARESMKRQRLAQPEKFKERDRKRYAKNPAPWKERSKTRHAVQMALNIDVYRAQSNARSRIWYARNATAKRDEFRKRGRASYQRNRSIYIARARSGRYRRVLATPAWLKASGQWPAMNQVYIEAKAAGMEVDHDIPLAGCQVCGAFGLHVLANLQIVDRLTNRAKLNRCMDCYLSGLGDRAGDSQRDCSGQHGVDSC